VKKKIAILVISILVTFFVYSLVGIFFNALNTRIYDSTPTQFYWDSLTPDYTLNVQINNNNPLPIPYFASFYTMSVNVTGGNGTYAYFEGIGGPSQLVNFTNSGLDAGRIDSGSSRTEPVMIHVCGGSFELRVDVWLNFFVGLKAGSASYQFVDEGNHYYNVTRMP
jgi:hypothetical protein